MRLEASESNLPCAPFAKTEKTETAGITPPVHLKKLFRLLDIPFKRFFLWTARTAGGAGRPQRLWSRSSSEVERGTTRESNTFSPCSFLYWGMFLFYFVPFRLSWVIVGSHAVKTPNRTCRNPKWTWFELLKLRGDPFFFKTDIFTCGHS